ncbi:hypothetical protein H9L39_03218 [Fusarium oxysporum f. sp. albedinis]|nr:hypothetical protein H9L39_03218 [Fusarium oxysporum f. sp. albedinis]
MQHNDKFVRKKADSFRLLWHYLLQELQRTGSHAIFSFCSDRTNDGKCGVEFLDLPL